MGKKIGIRHEDKYLLERRTPLVPEDIKILTNDKNLSFYVEKSEKRIFKDEEYKNAGAVITDNLDECDIIFGIKEVTIPSFKEGKTYAFFSHIIKGQEYNMTMLRKMMEKKINLIDYERVVDENNKRLIFFGNYAGLAGMIDTLWSIGLRLEHLGIDNPFSKLEQARKYNSLEEAKNVLKEISIEISQKGLPKELCPFVVGFTGYGNVSKGAQEIFDILPHEEVTPEQLLDLDKTNYSNKKLYKVIFKEEHLAERLDSSAFVLQDYYDHPEKFKGVFEQYIPKLTILMNCVYWTEKYPKLVTKKYLSENYSEKFKLLAIGDITCDVHGSVECTEKGTPIDDPIFVYDTKSKTYKMGHEGNGLLMMTVDILPSELPRESSEFFSEKLFPFIEEIAKCDFNSSYNDILLPDPIKKALILLKGKFTPDYEYINKYLK